MKLFIITVAGIVVQYSIILYQVRKEDRYARDIGIYGRSLPGGPTPGSEADGPSSSGEKKE